MVLKNSNNDKTRVEQNTRIGNEIPLIPHLTAPLEQPRASDGTPSDANPGQYETYCAAFGDPDKDVERG